MKNIKIENITTVNEDMITNEIKLKKYGFELKFEFEYWEEGLEDYCESFYIKDQLEEMIFEKQDIENIIKLINLKYNSYSDDGGLYDYIDFKKYFDKDGFKNIKFYTDIEEMLDYIIELINSQNIIQISNNYNYCTFLFGKVYGCNMDGTRNTNRDFDLKMEYRIHLDNDYGCMEYVLEYRNNTSLTEPASEYIKIADLNHLRNQQQTDMIIENDYITQELIEKHFIKIDHDKYKKEEFITYEFIGMYENGYLEIIDFVKECKIHSIDYKKYVKN